MFGFLIELPHVLRVAMASSTAQSDMVNILKRRCNELEER
jgi:hypothetical protein